ncbi:MAG: serine hydrolase, partial [Gammaproteobacteria bacterium]|nr:serine hydrolase [Gammaproteobacteria bacterium]
SDWVAVSHEPHAASPRGQGRYYGYGWWLRDFAGMRVPVAWGYGGQFIIVIDEFDLVVVATSKSTPGSDRRRHLRALYDLLEEQIILPLAAGS